MDYETLRNSMTVQDAARVLEETNCYGTMDIAKNVILKALEEQMSSSKEPNEWIPLIKRPMTKEEREEYEERTGIEETMIFNCPLPEDGQQVFVSYGDYVTIETFYEEDGGVCYFDIGDIDKADAWMTLPPSYKAENEDKND